MVERDESPEALAHVLVQRIFELLHECRATLANLEVPRSVAERLLYLALLGALEAGFVKTMEDAVSVFKRARAPLGPMGAEWLEAQARLLKQSRSEACG
jgi:hypothetical protein